MNRRLFFKSSMTALLGISTVCTGALSSLNLMASEALDAGIKKFKYIHTLPAKLKGAMKTHLKKLKKKVDSFEGVTINEANLKPTCQFCKFWENPTGEYAHCRYVAKKGNSKNQKAFIDAWCSMFNPVAKADDFKKRLALKK